MTEETNDEVEDAIGVAGDEKEVDWLAQAQMNTKATITDSDVGWASRAFLNIVMMSAKHGRRAGEARLAELAAERREELTSPFDRGSAPRAVTEPEKCGVNHCPGLMDWQTAPGFKLGPEAMAMADSVTPNHTLKVKICRSCSHIHEATKL